MRALPSDSGLRRAVLAILTAAACLGGIASESRAAARLATHPSGLLVSVQEGASLEAVLELSDDSGQPVTGVSFLAETSVGSLSSVSEPEPGRYVATLVAPPDDMPRAALVVFSPQNRDDLVPSWRVVPISVRTTLTARTEPRSQISAEVGSRVFGPVEAARDGSFSLDVDLPPGALEADIHLKDLAGNVTNTKLPVPRRRHDPLTVTLDRYRITSDGSGRARVFAFTFDESGRPVAGAALTGTASEGELGAFEQAEPGLWVASYAAPRDGRQSAADIEVRLEARGRSETEIDRISIVRGLPGSLDLVADPMRIIAGETSQVALVARVADSAGNPLAGQPLRLFADRGELAPLVDRGDGSYATSLAAPALVESGEIEVKALLPVGGPLKPPAQIAVTADPSSVPNSWRAFSLVTAVVTDSEGQPVPGEIVLFHVSRGQGTVTPAAISYDAGQAFADFAADPTEEMVTIEAVSTTTPSLRGSVSIQKRSSGQFSIITRPAIVAQGGQGSALLVLGEDKRVLQATVLLEIVAGSPQRLLASADPTRLPADGASQSALTARLLDAAGNEVRDEVLAWTADRGSLSGDSQNDAGAHESTFTAPEGRGSGRASIVVSHAGSGLSATLGIDLDLGPPARIALASDKQELPADGISRAMLTATVEDASGALIPGARVSFEVTAGDAMVAPSADTDTSGRAVVSLTASTLPEDVEITASLDDGLSASTTIELVAMRPERIEATARPARIRADGLERSEILVIVEDGLGQRLEDEPLSLRVSGSARLTQERLRTNSDGEARTWLAGDVAEIARVEVVPDRAPGLREEVAVELVADSLVASISADEPACASGFGLRGTAVGAVSFEWDWTGDGIADASGAVVTASLPAGPQEIVLRVRDAAGLTGLARLTVPVLPSPRAVIEPAPQHVASGSTVTLDGGASSGGTGILEWSWDIDADGSSDGDQPTIDWTAPDGLRDATLTITDASGCADTERVSVLFGDPPDLATSVSVLGATRVAPGTALQMEIGWANAGPPAARETEIRFTLAGPASLVESLLPPTARRVSPTEVVFPLGTIPAGSSGNFKVHVLAGQDFPGTIAQATGTSLIASPLGDAAPADNLASASFVVERAVDLAVSLVSASAAALSAGSPLDVVLEVRNLSQSDAPDATAQVSWNALLFSPTGFAPIAGAPAGRASFALGRITAGSTVTRTIPGFVAASLPALTQQLQIDAEAWFSGGDRNPADNRASLVRTLTAAPELSVSLQASPVRNPAYPGDTIEYAASWTNAGTTAADDVTITSRMTAGTLDRLADNPFGGILSGNELSFSLGRADVGDSGIIRWTALLAGAFPPGTPQACTDVVIAEAAGADPSPGNDTDSRCVPLDDAPVLAISVALPATAAAGSPFTCVVTVTNSGAPADGVEVELRLGGALASSGSATADPLVLRSMIGRVERGSPRTWRPQILPACPQAAVSPELEVQATLLAGGAPLPVTSSGRVTIASLPDLASSLVMPATGSAGDRLRGRLSLANVGCAPCADAEAEITWDAALASGAQPLILGTGALLAGAVATLDFDLDALAILPLGSNTLTVRSRSRCAGDPAPGNDSDTALVALSAAPDLSITSVGMPASLTAGEAADVTVSMHNGGSTAAQGITVSLSAAHPSWLAIVPPSVALPSIAAGGDADVTFRIQASNTLPSRSQITTLDASVTCANDSNPANDRSSSPLSLFAAPDLAVTLALSSASDPPLPGDVVRGSVVVENTGSTLSQGGSLHVERDAAVLLAFDGSQSASPFTIPLPDILPGASSPHQLSFVLVSPFPPGLISTVVGVRAEDAFDDNPANDSATRSLTLGDVVDVGVDLSLTPAAPVLAGESIRVTVKADNDGSLDATGVRAILTWDPAVLVQSVTPLQAMTGFASSAGRLEWLVDGLPSNDPGKTYAFTLTYASTLPSTSNALSLEAELQLDPVANPENDPADNRDAIVATALAQADLCLALVVDAVPAIPQPGGELGHSVSIENRGTTAASAAQLSLTVDPALGLPVRADAGATSAPGSVTWMLARIEPGATLTRFAAHVIPALPPPARSRTFAATATVSAAEDGPAGCPLASNTVSTLVNTEADLAVAKRLVAQSEDPPRRGSLLTYEITVTNVGGARTNTGSLVDRIPPETNVASTMPAGTVTGNEIRWSLGGIDPGQVLVFRVELEVDGSLAPGAYTLRNEAESSSPQDSNATNDLGVSDTSMHLDVDLEIAMTCVAVPAPAIPGSPIDCTGSVTNAGSYPAENPRLAVDVGPLARLDVSGASTATLPLLPGGAARSLLPRENVPFTFRLRSLAEMPQQLNTVSVTARAESDQLDADPADDSTSRSVSVEAWTDLRATLSVVDANGAPLVAGDQLDFTLSLTNAGGSMPATPVALTATYDASIAEPLPGGDLTGAGGLLSGTLGAPLGPLSPPAILRWSLRVLNPLPGPENAFTPCAGGSAPGERSPNDDSACTARLTALAWPDLVVSSFTATTATSPAAPGDVITYQATVTNAGTTAATAVRLTDNRNPALTTGLLWADVPASADGLTLHLPDLEVGDATSLSWHVGLAANMPTPDTLVPALACASALQPHRVPTGHCNQASVMVLAPVDAFVTLQATLLSGACVPGSEIRLDVAAGNEGRAPAINALLTLELPPDVNVLSAPGWNVAGSTLSRTIGNVAPGASAAPSPVMVRVAGTLPDASNALAITARITHDFMAAEADVLDDSAQAPLTCIAQADLVATLERTSGEPAPGLPLRYRARWRNAGTTTARSVRLTVADDALLVVAGAPEPGTLGRVYDLGDLGPGVGGPLDLDYTVLAVLPGSTNTLVERIVLSSATPEANPGDNSAERVDVIHAQADLASTITLVTPQIPANPGEQIVATIGWSNQGETASAGRLTFTHDTNVQVISMSLPPDDVSGRAHSFDLAPIAVGASGSMTVMLRVNNILPSPATNVLATSLIDAAEPDDDASNDADLASVLVAASPDLSIIVRIQEPNPAIVAAGGFIEGTVAILNTGSTRATGVGVSLSGDPSLLVASAECIDGPCSSAGGALTWTLGVVPVDPAPILKRFRMIMRGTLPAVTNTLEVEGRVYGNESETNVANNLQVVPVTVVGKPDLRLDSISADRTLLRPGDIVRVDYTYSNIGTAPADPAELHVTFTEAQLYPLQSSGATVNGGTLTFDWGPPLLPGGIATEDARFLVQPLTPPPAVREVNQVAVARERAPLLLTRDANPSDNQRDLKLEGCYITATVHVTLNRPSACMGSGVTVIADALPMAGVTYSWREANGLGTFTDTTARATTFFPPVTPGAATYQLIVTVRDAVKPACFVEVSANITTDPGCTSCGCSGPRMNVQYEGGLSRWDRAGDRSATQGESVAWRVALRLLNSRSGWLLGGAGNSQLIVSAGGVTYVAFLANDVWMECGQSMTMQFGPATVPANMPTGNHAIRFEHVTRDGCGNPVRRDNDNSTGDRITILPAPGGNSGITFTDWGPSTTGAPGR